MKALMNHFEGEGNATRNITKAERLRESCHYKNERSMAFELFITKFQDTYSIFEEEDQPLEKDAKIRFLFKLVEHSDLHKLIYGLKYQIATNLSGTVSYTTAANHLSTSVSDILQYISSNRSVSDVITVGEDQDSAYTADGTISTRYIPDYISLSNTDKKKVISERKKLKE